MSKSIFENFSYNLILHILKTIRIKPKYKIPTLID